MALGHGDPRVVLEVLESAFDGSLDRADQEAAADLAFSLGQDVPIDVEVLHRGGSLLAAGGEAAVTEVAQDYLRATDLLVPIRAASVRCPGFDLPRPIPDLLVAALRRLARQSVRVTVGTAAGEIHGRLAKAAPDHVSVSDGRGDVLVGLAEVRWVRLARGGSADAP